MDRVTAYPLEETTELDVLNTNKFAMIGLAKLAVAVLGTGPYLHGLACTPGAGLNISVGAGQIYKTGAIDATAYSSLGTDSHMIVKQGIALDSTVLSCPAPTSAGKSINYLVQIGYADVDTGDAILPFYNASNPALPYTGPGGSGASITTVRSAQCLVQVKAGAVATTGSQATPAADAGFVAAYVVQVDYGMSVVPSANITLAASAPFLTLTLPKAAPLDSPQLTGTPTVPDVAAGDSTAKASNTKFVGTAIANALVNTHLTGTPTVPDRTQLDNSASPANTHYVDEAIQSAVISAGGTPKYVNASFAAGSTGNYWTDTSAGPFTVTLPANPVGNNILEFHDISLSWGANFLTIDPGARQISGYAVSEKFILDVRAENAVGFWWDITNQVWRIK